LRVRAPTRGTLSRRGHFFFDCLRTPAEGIVISRLRVRVPTRGTLSRRGRLPWFCRKSAFSSTSAVGSMRDWFG